MVRRDYPNCGELPPNFLARTAAVRDEVDKAMQEKTVRTAESRQATSVQGQCQRDRKIWVRGLGKRCQSGIQLGANLPPEVGEVSSPATVPGMLEQMSKTLSLAWPVRARHGKDRPARVESYRRRPQDLRSPAGVSVRHNAGRLTGA